MNEKRFLELLKKEEGKLFRIALAILGQEADAWDVLQETTEQAWLKIDSLKGGDIAFPAWIRRILVNRSISILRKQDRIVLLEPSHMPEPEKDAHETDLHPSDLWELVKSLDKGHRQVVALRYLGELSLQEISMELGLPIGTVKSRLHRALARLRKAIEKNNLRSESL